MLTRPGDELQASPSCLVFTEATPCSPEALAGNTPGMDGALWRVSWGRGRGKVSHRPARWLPACRRGVRCLGEHTACFLRVGGKTTLQNNPRESLSVECNQSGTLLRFWMKMVSQYSVLSGMWGITTCVITMNLITVLLAVRTSMYSLFSLSMITVQTALPVPSSVRCSLGCLLQRLHRIMSAVVRQESP